MGGGICLSLNGIPKIPIFHMFKLSSLRKKLVNFFPDDFIFVVLDKEISKKDEDNLITNFISENLNFPEINIFSHKNYNKTKLKTKTTIQFDKLKILEKLFFFIIYEYPQFLNKENDYYSILLYGVEENNVNFIDGFLNFLLDINDEDNYTFKLECVDKKNNLIEHRYIQSNKGNFSFISINEKQFSEEEVEEILNFLNNEKYINHLVITQEDIFNKLLEYTDEEEIKNFDKNFISVIVDKINFEFLKLYIKDYNNNKEIFKEIHKDLLEEIKEEIKKEKEKKKEQFLGDFIGIIYENKNNLHGFIMLEFFGDRDEKE